MNIHDATEEAYKRGYENGVKEFAEKLHEVIKFYYPEQKLVHIYIDTIAEDMKEEAK